MESMRSLSPQVRLRRLIRSYGEAADRLMSEPQTRQMAATVVARLLELTGEVREAWRRESLAGRPPRALERYVREALRTMELAIAGAQQAGAELQLRRSDFETSAQPP